MASQPEPSDRVAEVAAAQKSSKADDQPAVAADADTGVTVLIGEYAPPAPPPEIDIPEIKPEAPLEVDLPEIKPEVPREVRPPKVEPKRPPAEDLPARKPNEPRPNNLPADADLETPHFLRRNSRATRQWLPPKQSARDGNNAATKNRPKKSPAEGALSGIKILDLTRLYPGPLATMMMADMGAEVIKIEDMISPDTMRTYPPYHGDMSAGYLAVNRSKRSIALKFNEERGREVFFRLARDADIVIEQFRPGVLDKIGIGYTEAIKTNPRIIYISLTGYGQTGPYAQKAGHDVNYLGYSGVTGTTGTEQSPSVLSGVQIADVAGGAYMAIIAALSAIWARENTGVGQRVDVSMLDGVMPLMSLQLAQYWATNQAVPPWQMPLSGGWASYGIYLCRDGRYVSLGALEAKFWKKFCQLIDKPQWEERYYGDSKAQAALKADLTRMFLERDRDEWLRLVGRADVCLTPVLGIDEIEHDPHLQARNMIVEHDHPIYGRLKTIGMPLKFSHAGKGEVKPAPMLGDDTIAIMQELGYSESEIREMQKKRIIFTTPK